MHMKQKKTCEQNKKQQLKQLTPKLQHWQNPFFSYWITVFIHMEQQYPVKKKQKKQLIPTQTKLF